MAENAGLPSEAVGEPAGVYLYRAAEDAWWWSDEVFAIHGLEPGAAVPSTELLLDHQHPEDRDHAREILRECLSDGHPFSSYHRVVTADGKVRRVVVTGDGRLDAEGRVTGVRGFIIDVTEPVTRDIRTVSDETIAAARRSQETIDQARGIVMGVYGVDADTALAMLRRHSQHTNTRLRDLADALVNAAPAPPGSLRNELRRRLEGAFYPDADSAGDGSRTRPATTATRTVSGR